MYSKNNQPFEVIVSHPARQGNIYERPLAAQRQGIPVKFLTGLYYKPEQFPYSLVRFLPSNGRVAVLRQLEKRHLRELNPKSVISMGGPWLEMIFRPLGFLNAWQKKHDWLASRWIERLPTPDRPTLLHCFDGSAKRTLRAARTKGIKTLYEITVPALATFGIETQESRRLGFSEKGHRSAQRWAKRILEEYSAANYLVAQSTITKDHLLQIGIAPKQIILMPLGININQFRPAPEQDIARPFRCLFVGRIGIAKGLPYLLDAWKQLNLANAELVLAGSIDSRKFGAELLQRYKGVYRWLSFLPQHELAELYRDSDIFVLPSLSEGSSMAMMEAMASGLPCIVSPNAGCILRDGVEGFVSPVASVGALKDRIRQLYLNPELRRAMGVAARARAEQFTWEEYGRRLCLMYRNVLFGERELARNILDMVEL